MNSNHYKRDRKRREEIVKQIGTGNVIKEVVLNRGHKNGPEVHKVTDTGLVLVYNQRTNVLITKLIARPNQIRRYYKEDEVVPTDIIALAKYHTKMKWNEV